MNCINEKVHSCSLCYNALCGDVERIIRAVKFDNIKGACFLLNDNFYLDDDVKCICNVDYKNIINELISLKKELNIPSVLDVDLTTDICGVKLENPFLLSSSVVGSNYEMCKRALDSGWAGVVYKTISLIDIHETSPRFSSIKDSDNSFIGFKNIYTYFR